MGPIEFTTMESVPKQFSDHMDWYQGEDKECAAADGFPNQDLYYPILYQSEFWIAFGSLKEINGSMKDSELNVNYEPVAVSSSRHLNFALTFHV